LRWNRVSQLFLARRSCVDFLKLRRSRRGGREKMPFEFR
jgi:hypothetical protein